MLTIPSLTVPGPEELLLTVLCYKLHDQFYILHTLQNECGVNDCTGLTYPHRNGYGQLISHYSTDRLCYKRYLHYVIGIHAGQN